MSTINRFAVMGHPISHSRSPLIHTTFAKQFGIHLVYEKIEVPINGFAEAVEQFFSRGGHGLNITVPFKEEAWQLAQGHLSERALLAGAVNTLWQKAGKLHGCNTDGVGLVSDLKRLDVSLKQARVLVLGAGGAARGIVGPLFDAGCQAIHIVNRTASRAHTLVADLSKNFAGVMSTHPHQSLTAGSLDEAQFGAPWSLVINATASGLSHQAPQLPSGLYATGALAYDMMYGAEPTAFMQQAAHDGATRQADGLGMLVGQAAESFYIWHGVKPNTQPVIDLIRASF